MSMSWLELFILALGLAMDAFAAAICSGLGMQKVTLRKALTVGLYFGVFQGAMPLIGYGAAALFADKIKAYDHWVAFGLLCFLGGKMIWGSLKKQEPGEESGWREGSLGPRKMLPLAVATSIDAMAVGVSFAFLKVQIVPAVSIIGVVTLLLSMVGVKLGNLFGSRFKSKAEFAGGLILCLIGIKILLEHLNILP